ncbi:hypothetical protein R1sor_007213 [Riccia sorocarpa]|uniref:Uncharacterized protein n=1 Tax=Riccia sorocarpa TaxID=122646 RepID=A0ABD3HSR8_9MARC
MSGELKIVVKARGAGPAPGAEGGSVESNREVSQPGGSTLKERPVEGEGGGEKLLQGEESTKNCVKG